MPAKKLFDLDPLATQLPWLESPFTKYHLENSQLPPEQLAVARAFADNGYAVIDSGLDPALLDRAKAVLEERYAENSGTGYATSSRIQDGWFTKDTEVQDVVLQIATAKNIVNTLRMLYRREPIPFQTLNFPCGTEQHTHSDVIHFSSAPERFMAAAWVALEDIHPDSGPLHYFVHSHKLPIYSLETIGITGSARRTTKADPGEDYAEYERFVRALMHASGLPRLEFHAKKGQAFIWSTNLFHGGSAIRDRARSRHSQATHYYFAHSLYYSPLVSDPLIGQTHLRRVVNLRNGYEMPHIYNGEPIPTRMEDGHLFPLPHPPKPAPPAYPLHTDAPFRILAWPTYTEPALRALCDTFVPALIGRTDCCLCLRHDPQTDVPMDDAVRLFERLLKNRVPEKEPLKVLVVNDGLDAQTAKKLGRELTCAVASREEPASKTGFLRELEIPILYTGEALKRALAI